MRSLMIAGLSLALATPAAADRWATAGTRGTVTAYDLDARTVLEHRVCFRHASGAYDYIGCGDRLRDDLKVRMCNLRGPGTHHYYYQVGETKPYWSSMFCPRKY